MQIFFIKIYACKFITIHKNTISLIFERLNKKNFKGCPRKNEIKISLIWGQKVCLCVLSTEQLFQDVFEHLC